MRYIAPLLILFALLPITSSADDKNQVDVAEVTTLTLTVGTQFKYDTAEIVSGTRVLIEENITIKKIEGEKLTVDYQSSVQKDGKKQILASQTITWQTPPPKVFKTLTEVKKLKPEPVVVSNKKFLVLKVRVDNNLYWFATDGKKIMFPGLVRRIVFHGGQCSGHILNHLKEIVQP
jgi:hypothetical protein